MREAWPSTPASFLDLRPSIPLFHLTLAVIHRPAVPNAKLGSHAASQAGKAPPTPSARPSCCKTKKTKQIRMLLATPTKIFRRPEAPPEGGGLGWKRR